MVSDDLNTTTWLHAKLTEILRAEIGFHEQFATLVAAAILYGMHGRMGEREICLPILEQNKNVDAMLQADIRRMFTGKNMSEVMRQFGVCPVTVYRAWITGHASRSAPAS